MIGFLRHFVITICFFNCRIYFLKLLFIFRRFTMCLVDTYLPSNLSNISSSPLKLCSIVFRVLVLAEYILPVGHITSKNKSAGSNLEKWRTIYLVFFLAYFGRYCGLLESLKKCFAAKGMFGYFETFLILIKKLTSYNLLCMYLYSCILYVFYFFGS